MTDHHLKWTCSTFCNVFGSGIVPFLPEPEDVFKVDSVCMRWNRKTRCLSLEAFLPMFRQRLELKPSDDEVLREALGRESQFVPRSWPRFLQMLMHTKTALAAEWPTVELSVAILPSLSVLCLFSKELDMHPGYHFAGSRGGLSPWKALEALPDVTRHRQYMTSEFQRWLRNPHQAPVPLPQTPAHKTALERMRDRIVIKNVKISNSCVDDHGSWTAELSLIFRNAAGTREMRVDENIFYDNNYMNLSAWFGTATRIAQPAQPATWNLMGAHANRTDLNGAKEAVWTRLQLAEEGGDDFVPRELFDEFFLRTLIPFGSYMRGYGALDDIERDRLVDDTIPERFTIDG
uniref:Uncharacterized protein n=1 Tax=Chromera velia CCMP2878 TaxID=1169474 RepID=A0A0G4FKR0_9ALVE|eukprot:Cvel_17372.t1-p1 / transcript=Cvel_17372.t1 / gene=Cvel_17372 / organism=Chromera_velia_CCMP2878 / gene_product=hypothetical protein / transcript_product=hypothetical protein / location=Cvel_scaffold1381:1590-3836(+) / protein_length=346 / sequence_SO=supercontig / SO=protein_coding / is_pseudo=false